MSEPSPFPREFFCEHTPSKSRVLALSRYADGPGRLRAVLTSTDRVLAEWAAQVLTAVAASGNGDEVDAEAERLLAELPAAPADSLRAALAQLRAAEWPAVHGHVTWDQLKARQADAEISGNTTAAPDFTALFPIPACEGTHWRVDDDVEKCSACAEWHVTPRTADVLHTALTVLSDQAHDDVDERGSQPVEGKNDCGWLFFDRLPRLTWGMSSDWRRGIAHACEDLIRDLAEGNWPEPRTNAEEIALHLAITDAPAYLDMIEDGAFPEHNALRRHADDYAWECCAAFLFQDDDVMLLYSAGMDGIEAPDNEINREAGMGDLRPAAWFDLFDNVEPRDPARTFRRYV